MPSIDITPTCVCPPDGKLQLLAKINNNLAVTFNLLMPSFSGQLVNVGQCLCSEAQILAALNNNIVNFFEAYGGGSGLVPVNNDVHSWAELAAVPTVGAAVPTIMLWFETATSLYRVTVLQAGTDATDTANGIQRPDDYAAANQNVWYQAGSGA
jgi:hypothetical protein